MSSRAPWWALPSESSRSDEEEKPKDPLQDPKQEPLQSENTPSVEPLAKAGIAQTICSDLGFWHGLSLEQLLSRGWAFLARRPEVTNSLYCTVLFVANYIPLDTVKYLSVQQIQ